MCRLMKKYGKQAATGINVENRGQEPVFTSLMAGVHSLAHGEGDCIFH